MPRQSRRLLLRSGLPAGSACSPAVVSRCRLARSREDIGDCHPPAGEGRRIGVLWADTPGDLHAAFAQGLVEQGRREGPSLVIETDLGALPNSTCCPRPPPISSRSSPGVDLIVAPSTPGGPRSPGNRRAPSRSSWSPPAT